ncbi:MAG: low molecular weight protein-tyrosine-phosphatase [Enterobacterales bacterium]|nr:low molecular weight protein-tyrosine-phosphatase [Enterobacterales bacterium]
MKHTKILFVCMGNICRSPTAEGIFRQLASMHSGLGRLKVDSCGTIGYHVGEPPDSRAQAAALERGYDISMIRARKLVKQNLENFDWIIAMDHENIENIRRLDLDSIFSHKIKLFLDFTQSSQGQAVPDPYYGGEQGFDKVIDLVEEASEGLIQFLLNAK